MNDLCPKTQQPVGYVAICQPCWDQGQRQTCVPVEWSRAPTDPAVLERYNQRRLEQSVKQNPTPRRRR